MTTSLVLTFVGRDRPGLVRAVSETVAAFGGSWLESRMARLAGEFAGIVLVSVPAANVDDVTIALSGLETHGLRVTVERSSGERSQRQYSTVRLDLVGHDRPGIVRDITKALAQRGVNIDEFSSRLASASFSGEELFHVTARLQVPDDVGIDDLRNSLERLANEIMVDITLEEDPERNARIPD